MATDLAARLYDSIVSVELGQLRAQVAALTTERDALRARVAELSAPPVVPGGFMVLKVPHEVDHQEYVDRWELWQLDGNEPPFVLAFVRSGDVWCDSYALGDRAAVRAFLWAIEHDARPPHAGDEKVRE